MFTVTTTTTPESAYLWIKAIKTTPKMLELFFITITMNTLKVGEKEIFWFDFAFFYLSVIKHANIESTDTIRPG